MPRELSESSILEELHEDEEELRRDEKRVRIAFVLVFALIIVSLAAVSYLIFVTMKENKPTIIVDSIPSGVSVSPTPLPSPSVAPAQTSITTTEKSNKSTVKDYYINIGYGTNRSLDWKDVDGALTTADINAYDNIKEVHFEAFINVPTANGSVSVRLFNKTDNYAVWNSEITRDGTKDTYQFISPALIYDRGPRLYQVQMKSQLNVLVNLVSARIRIVTE